MAKETRIITSQESRRDIRDTESLNVRPVTSPFLPPVTRTKDQEPGQCVKTGMREDVTPHLDERTLILIATLEFASSSNLSMITKAQDATIVNLLEGIRRDKLADRTWLPDEKAQSGQWIYFLTTRGAKVASNLLNEKVYRPRIDERVSLLLHHRTAISQAVAGLAAGLGDRRLELCRVGRRLRSTMKNSSLKGIYFPDAYLAFTIQTTEEEFVRHLFLEVDRGTERRSQLKSKFHSLNSYYLQDHQRLFHTNRLVVAITVPSRHRCRTISEIVRETKSRVRVLVALQSKVSKEDQALASWTDCITGKRRHLLETPQGPSKGDLR